MRAMSAPENSDGTYIASTWLWMTQAVSRSECPSCACMLSGVAVMTRFIMP